MAVQRKKLRVLPNPWLHIDEKGRPAGLCRLEQPNNRHVFVHGWVGATVATVTEVEPAKRVTIGGRTFEQKAGIHYLTFAHSDEPVTVDNTQYYRKRVACGDLIAFDVETAKACGIRAEQFVEPAKLLEQIKADAVRQFDAENGEGAFETLADMAVEESEEQAAVDAAVAQQSGQANPAAPAPSAPAPTVLQGTNLPADGAARTADLQPADGQAALPEAQVDAAGSVDMTEHEAPALDTDSNRAKKRKGSDQ